MSLFRVPSCECLRFSLGGGAAATSGFANAPTRALRRGYSAIHEPSCARYVACLIGGEEGIDIGHFLRRAAPANGTAEINAFSISSSTAPVSLCVQAVSIGPGHTQFARTPYWACSTAAPAMKA
jgi:hypothetical protein